MTTTPEQPDTPNGRDPATLPASTTADQLLDLHLGGVFNPIADGAYEWQKLHLKARRLDSPVLEDVTVYLLIWNCANGRFVMNLVGDDAMRDFLRNAQEQFSGILLPGLAGL